MALHIGTAGRADLLNKMLQAALSVNENYILRLYQNNYTPVDNMTSGSFTESSFTNYVPVTLTRAGWNNAVANGSLAQTSYGASPLSWTCGATGQTVYGYYILGAISNDVLWAELFGTARTLAQNDILNLTPTFTLGSQS